MEREPIFSFVEAENPHEDGPYLYLDGMLIAEVVGTAAERHERELRLRAALLRLAPRAALQPYPAEVREAPRPPGQEDEKRLRLLTGLHERRIAPELAGVRRLVIRGFAARTADFLGVACPKCGMELVDPDRSSLLLTSRRRRDACCAGCGFRGGVPDMRPDHGA